MLPVSKCNLFVFLFDVQLESATVWVSLEMAGIPYTNNNFWRKFGNTPMMCNLETDISRHENVTKASSLKQEQNCK